MEAALLSTFVTLGDKFIKSLKAKKINKKIVESFEDAIKKTKKDITNLSETHGEKLPQPVQNKLTEFENFLRQTNERIKNELPKGFFKAPKATAFLKELKEEYKKKQDEFDSVVLHYTFSSTLDNAASNREEAKAAESMLSSIQEEQQRQRELLKKILKEALVKNVIEKQRTVEKNKEEFYIPFGQLKFRSLISNGISNRLCTADWSGKRVTCEFKEIQENNQDDINSFFRGIRVYQEVVSNVNVVHMYGVSRAKGVICIVMEHLDYSLIGLLKNESISFQEAIKAALESVEVLLGLHKLNIFARGFGLDSVWLVNNFPYGFTSKLRLLRESKVGYLNDSVGTISQFGLELGDSLAPEEEKNADATTALADVWRVGVFIKKLFEEIEGAKNDSRFSEINKLIKKCFSKKPKERPSLEYIRDGLRYLQKKKWVELFNKCAEEDEKLYVEKCKLDEKKDLGTLEEFSNIVKKFSDLRKKYWKVFKSGVDGLSAHALRNLMLLENDKSLERFNISQSGFHIPYKQLFLQFCAESGDAKACKAVPGSVDDRYLANRARYTLSMHKKGK